MTLRPTRLALLALLAAAPAAAQETRDSLPVVDVPPIVVTATRTPAPADRVASAVTVVTAEEIARRGHRTALDVLREVPGVAVGQSGGPGGPAAVFLRGAAPDHTLVLVDGVAVNDPSSPNRAYDFAHVLAADLDRIEVLRGPQSPLWGSSALGGVIHLITRRGEGPARVSATIEAGAFGTREIAASAGGGAGALAWSATVARRASDGISAAPERSGNREADAHASTMGTVRLDWEGGRHGLALLVRGISAESDFDQEGATGDDPNAESSGDEVVARAEGRLDLAGGRWTQTFAASLADHDRETADDVDAAHPDTRSLGTFDGRRAGLQWLHDVRAAGRWTGGVEWERESAATTFSSDGPFGPFESAFPEESARTVAGWLQHQAALAERLFVAVGARVDDHERFGAATTWRVAPALVLASGTRLRATWGTAFKAPTLFQLLDPQFGNPDLDPERSRGWDAGIDQELGGGRARVSATAFGTEFEEFVAFAFPDGYRNAGAASSRGFELAAALEPAPGLRVDAAWTRTDTEDESGGPDDGERLIRRPRDVASLALGWSGAAADVVLGARWVGERDDLDFSTFPAARVTLDGHALVRAAATWRATDRVRVFGRIENLLDEEVEEVLHFGAPGRAAYAGVRADL